MEVHEAPPDAALPARVTGWPGRPRPRNFNAGLAVADWREYTHVMKLDGDIELPPNLSASADRAVRRRPRRWGWPAAS